MSAIFPSKKDAHLKSIFLGLIVLVVALFVEACVALQQRNTNVTYLGVVDRGFLANLVWSPSGEKIAVTAYNDGNNTARIYSLDIATQNFQKILETTYGSITVTGWSPDEKKLLFSSDDGGKEFKPGIWLYNIDGKTPPEFLSGGYLASWSPIGDKVAVAEVVQEASTWDISLHILAPDTSNDEVVYSTQGKYIDGLSWSPDGKRLVFAFSPDAQLSSVNIYILDVTSGELTQLTTSGRNISPVWSPRGNMIAYVTEDLSNNISKIYIQDSNGECRITAPNLADGSHPTWSPDGKYIAFIREIGGIYKLDLVREFGEAFIIEGPFCP